MTAVEQEVKVRPLRDYIFAKRASGKREKIGSIIIAPDMQVEEQYAEVTSCGPGNLDKFGRYMAPHLMEGDRILMARAWDKPVDLGGITLAAIHESDVMAVTRDGTDVLLFNQVAVKLDPLEEIERGLHLPMQVKRPLMAAMLGTVVEVGPGHRMKDGSILPLDIEVNQRVYVEAFGGEDQEFNGEMLRLIPEERILAILNE